MPTSDSEDFESADEGTFEKSFDKKERKKRLSSSNYSDSAADSDHERKKDTTSSQVAHKEPVKKIEENADGWDDFDIEEDDATNSNKNTEKIQEAETKVKTEVSKEPSKSQDTGWDEFDDWGQDETENAKIEEIPADKLKAAQSPDIKSVADKLAASSIKSEDKGGGWGWGGWGVDSLLSTATAGINTITTHVSQGISTVLETGIGAPDPEDLARQTRQTPTEAKPELRKDRSDDDHVGVNESGGGERDMAFPFGNIISGVTKFVESTSTKVIAGGLDTLETIGKKTMEVLQDGDPGLAKKRAMLGLDPGDKPVLSQVLREAKTRADEEDRIREEKREAKEVHYETLFDDFEGLVHLEALEMLSKQVSMRIEERLRSANPDKRQEIKETLQQVAELCEMPDEDEDDDASDENAGGDSLHEKLLEATQDLGLKIQFQPLVKHYTETLSWLQSEESVSEKVVYKRAVSSLAQYTALSVELYHKTAEMLLVKTRRSTADESDALTQTTVVLTKHISNLATNFTQKLNSIATENKEQINTYITNVFLEAGNSSTYLQNAFQLALPILQIGAV